MIENCDLHRRSHAHHFCFFFLPPIRGSPARHHRPAIPIALHRSIRIPASIPAVRIGRHQLPTTPRTTVNSRRQQTADPPAAQNPHPPLPVMSLRVTRRALLALVAGLLCVLSVSSAHGADVASPSRPHALFIAIPLPVRRRRSGSKLACDPLRAAVTDLATTVGMQCS